VSFARLRFFNDEGKTVQGAPTTVLLPGAPKGPAAHRTGPTISRRELPRMRAAASEFTTDEWPDPQRRSTARATPPSSTPSGTPSFAPESVRPGILLAERAANSFGHRDETENRHPRPHPPACRRGTPACPAQQRFEMTVAGSSKPERDQFTCEPGRACRSLCETLSLAVNTRRPPAARAPFTAIGIDGIVA